MPHKGLHTPLLGDELPVAIIIDHEASSSSSQQAGQDDMAPEKKPTGTVLDDQDDVGTCWGPSWIMSILFPLSMLLQFWLALAAADEDDDEHNNKITTLSIISWPNISLTIGIFAVRNWLYQRACQDFKIQSLILLLLPEIITILVLGLVMFEETDITMAFLALNAGIFLLSLLVLGTTARSLFCSSETDDDEDEDDDEKEDEVKKTYILIV
jgi:hypothetical protein